MPIYEIRSSSIEPVHETTFRDAKIRERSDLQRLLRDNIEVIAPDTLVIAEEFGEWLDSRRRIDLLGIDKAANLVVVELKRTEDGGHMDLQALRYAAMVSPMTFEKAVEIFGRYLESLGREEDPEARLLSFLEWDEADEEAFAQDVRIVLASAEFSRELTTCVMWLNERDLDIRRVRLRPYDLDGRILIDVQQIVPLPEAADYQVQVREKARQERKSRNSAMDFTRFDVSVKGDRATGLPKRRAIFFVCKHLCDAGIAPERIAGLMDWRPTRIWKTVDGEVDAETFLTMATEAAKSGAGLFKRRKWFCEDEELVRQNGKTYAFSNQWGGEKWYKAMRLLQAEFPEFEIEYSPTA